MLIHARLPISTVNGPGSRAVVWFQGCSLDCRGCWNTATHSFAPGVPPPHPPNAIEAKHGSSKTLPIVISADEMASWILSCQSIEGVTFSGGEPLQQAPDLLRICEVLHTQRPRFSIGIFTGYTMQELSSGRWKWIDPTSGEWHNGSADLFVAIRKHLDFAVMGRYVRHQATTDKPLCGSINQEVVFFGDRYSEADIEPQAYEISISEDGGQVATTGFPPQFLTVADGTAQ